MSERIIVEDELASPPESRRDAPIALPRPRTRFGPGSVQGLLRLLLLVVLVPILLAQLVMLYDRYQSERGRELRANLEFSRAVAVGLDAHVQDILRQQLSVGHAITSLGPLPFDRLSRFLHIAGSDYPSLRGYTWMTPDGRIVATGTAPDAIGLDLSDRPYYREIVAGREWVVSDLIVGRLTNMPSVTITRGIRDENGTLQGIVLGALQPHLLGSMLGVERTEDGEFSIYDRQGWLVYRYPEDSFSMEERQREAGTPLIAEALAGREVTDTTRSRATGQSQIMAATPVRSIGWAVSASRPESAVVVPIRNALLQQAGVFLLVAGAALGIALVIGRDIVGPLRRLREHAIAIGRGEFDRPVDLNGPTEVSDLANAIERMAAELRSREDQRETYVHTISHDLRGPLTMIRGQAQILERLLVRSEAPRQEQRCVEAIITGTTRMNSMINDLVDSARLDLGQLELSRQIIDPRHFINDLRERLNSPETPERIVVDAPDTIPVVLADPDRLERVLLNLIGNALAYSDPSTRVKVALTCQNDEVIFAISDQGPGIDPADLPHLFQRYRRTDSSRGTPGGLGLGLYIARGLVEAHGGRIWVESKPGQGSTFTFALPTVGEHG